MIKLIINFLILIFLLSCQIKDVKKISQIVDIKKEPIEKIEKLIDKKTSNVSPQIKNNTLKYLKYVLGDSYFIDGVEYIPEENYDYNQIGLASFYNKELHNIRTINNDYNKVTELLGRHKTLPIPSIVKVTNLENGLSITLKINDRHNDNSSIIQVSRKSAQLLKFYKNKIARVRIEILSDPSKQMKIVTQTMNQSSFNETVISAPTEIVSITDINQDLQNNLKSNQESPIEINFSEITKEKMFLRIYGFDSYKKAKLIYGQLELKQKFTIQNDQGSYSLIIGPLENIEANNLVLSFISRGYKKTEFFLE